MKTNFLKRNNVWNRTNNYIGTVKVTLSNMVELQKFRKSMNEVGKRISLRGRHPNRKLVAKLAGSHYAKAKQDVPFRFATSFDVYWHS